MLQKKKFGHVAKAPDDARTFPVACDENGICVRPFQDVALTRKDDFADFAVKGPRAIRWRSQLMPESAGTPMGHHQKWKTDFRPSSAYVGAFLQHLAGQELMNHLGLLPLQARGHI